MRTVSFDGVAARQGGYALHALLNSGRQRIRGGPKNDPDSQ
jgi:hypothetical protein